MCSNPFSSKGSKQQQDMANQKAQEQAAAEAAAAQQNAALVAKQQQDQALQNRKGSAREAISAVYAPLGGFVDSLQAAARDPYRGELDTKRAAASRRLETTLAGRGMGNSSIAEQRRRQLASVYDTTQSDVVRRSGEEADRLRHDVNVARDDYLARALTSDNPDLVAQEATARATELRNRQIAQPPLGDVFAGVMEGFPDTQQRPVFGGGAAGTTGGGTPGVMPTTPEEERRRRQGSGRVVA